MKRNTNHPLNEATARSIPLAEAADPPSGSRLGSSRVVRSVHPELTKVEGRWMIRNILWQSPPLGE